MTDQTDVSLPQPGTTHKRVVVITGASRGLGRAVAQALAGADSHLVLIARTSGGLEEVDDYVTQAGGSATLVPLDLTEFGAIDRLGAALYERFGKVDGFVGAAAQLGVLSPVGHIKPDVWTKTFDLNVTANWRLIRTLDPLFRMAEAARVVLVTDRKAREREAYWAVYAASKAALETLALTYAAEVAHTGISVTTFDPGPMATALRGRAYPGEDRSALQQPKDAAQALVPLVLGSQTITA
ncbi:MAG: SDR family oxidoreductase [Pseudomonadota bacterium]